MYIILLQHPYSHTPGMIITHKSFVVFMQFSTADMEDRSLFFTIPNLVLEPNSSVSNEYYTSGAPSAARMLANFIYHVIMSAVTAVGNGLTLLAWVRDPMKCFRSPSSFLVMSMTIANLLISLIVEPMYGVFYYIFFVQDAQLYSSAFKCYVVGVDTSTIAFNTSFLIVFVMSLDLYFALSRPLKYRMIVTKKVVFVCLATIWSYTTIFAFLPHIGISLKIYHKTDLFLNTIIFFVLLLASYVALLKSFHKQRQNAVMLKPRSNLIKILSCTRQRARDKKFLVAIFLQVLVVSLAVVPNMIFMITEFYCFKCKLDQDLIIVRNILQNVVLMKFAADPFIYAWRVPRYRHALQVALRCNMEPFLRNRGIKDTKL